ncbi:hypothetical protein niasHT_007059 [Heterodera trifolii]|uniref:Uncharacterized protein n=1 Tax=Heterodera trifolii TaxID=157864 RepID=A0ABD2LXG4_9BILA
MFIVLIRRLTNKESESIEHEYLRLLFDERLSEEKLQSLAIFQLHNASGTKLNLLEGKENVPKQSLKKMRKEYVKWTAEMDKNTEIGMNELGKWWEMERQLERMVEMNMLGESFESPRKSIGHKCEENCACARQPLNWTDRGNWPDGLELDLSFKHLQFLDNVFCGTEYNHFLYEHFIVVTCTASQFQIEQFSDFVGHALGRIEKMGQILPFVPRSDFGGLMQWAKFAKFEQKRL